MNALIRIAWDWGIRCFGEKHMTNPRIRALRMVEEAIEVAQASGVPVDLLHKQVDVTYARPVGEVGRELGGMLVTTYMMCMTHSLDPDEVFEREVRRCLSKTPEHFAKRNQEKLDLGLDT